MQSSLPRLLRQCRGGRVCVRAELRRGHGYARPASGASARVEFFDGEVIHGRVAQYSVEEHGFFLFPTAPESNNEKIFVVVQALKTLYVETLADGES